MKLLVDASCVRFGGVMTYAQELLAAWRRDYPDDEIHVAVDADAGLRVPEGVTVHPLRFPRPVPLTRPLRQTRALRRLVRRLEVDAVLVTLPSTSVLRLPARTVVVVHDLRHDLRPEQFSRQQRALRRISYGRAYAVADALVADTRRTLDDLHGAWPATRRKPGHVVHLGADHVDSWPRGEPTGRVVTFGHHTNKNTRLAVDAWAVLAGRGRAVPTLQVLGLGAAGRETLASALAELGLGGRVQLSPFLPDEEFEQTLTGAGMVLFLSDFEGFGLPAAEAMRLGTPLVIGPERALLEVTGGNAVVADDWTPEAVADAVERALDEPVPTGAAARAADLTWAATVRRTRAALIG